MEITITNHADMRIKERVGIKSARRRAVFAEAAYTYGIRFNECLDRRSAIEITAHNKCEYREVVIYRDQLFIFDGSVLVTVLPVNKEYRRVMEAKRAKTKRNSVSGYAA